MRAIREEKRHASWFGKIAVLGAGLMLMAGVNSASAALTVLHSFSGYPTDGETPYAGLVADDQGNLYGTTAFGGAGRHGQTTGEGTVFKLSPDGTYKVLYSFAGGSDGGQPNAGLIIDRSGNLYGTATFGGCLAVVDIAAARCSSSHLAGLTQYCTPSAAAVTEAIPRRALLSTAREIYTG
jgi:uncharacterized repeat protein (TIGR03803 family)